MVGIQVSFWDGLFSGAMLVSARASHTLPRDIKFVTDLKSTRDICTTGAHKHTTDKELRRYSGGIRQSTFLAHQGRLVDLKGWPAEVVLLGDSTLDNERPIFSGPAAMLNKESGTMWGPTLWTCYGSCRTDTNHQKGRLSFGLSRFCAI